MSEPAPPAVALVDPDAAGNVGMAARAMKNFGFRDLLLVDPPPLPPDGEAYGFAGRAREDVLAGATTCAFGTLVETYHTVGFTAVTNEDATSHVRFPFATVDDLADELGGVGSDVALVFGRERTGLTNDELARLDRVATIPAAAAYPTLNLAQAVTIALYELQALTDASAHHVDVDRHRADEADLERLYATFERLLEAIGHPPEKRDKAGRMVRRLFGRADLTDREVRTLMGIVRRGAALAERAPLEGDRPPEPPVE